MHTRRDKDTACQFGISDQIGWHFGGGNYYAECDPNVSAAFGEVDAMDRIGPFSCGDRVDCGDEGGKRKGAAVRGVNKTFKYE